MFNVLLKDPKGNIKLSVFEMIKLKDYHILQLS